MEINVSWSVFKNTIDTRGWKIQCIGLLGGANDGYYLSAGNAAMKLTCMVPITDPANDDQTDFETNYLSLVNQDPINGVQTQFEMPNYLLQMANIGIAEVAPGATETAMIKIPGEFSGPQPPADGRYIDA